MRAMVYDTDGARAGELRLAELPDPEPGPGQVRVRVEVAAVNATDWKARANGPAGRTWQTQVPGQDGAGVIDRVGPGVDPARIGERVWLHHAALGHAGGSAAELVVVPSRQAAALPAGITSDVGATLGIPWLTAHRCLLADGPVEGGTVLVTGGGGAVGHAAVQLARRAGARVITTVSGPERAAIARTAGPDVILGYRDADHAAQLRAAAPAGIDRVIDVDVAVNLAAYEPLLRPGAAVASFARSAAAPVLTLPVGPLVGRNVLVRFVSVYGVAEADLDAGVAAVDALLRTGRAVAMPVIRYPLERLGEAHDHVRAGALGRVLVDVGG
jgi:NADPH2:quinone reductase